MREPAGFIIPLMAAEGPSTFPSAEKYQKAAPAPVAIKGIE
ncbi:MAG: hypothetical protein V4721_10120 [Bacteroidota bacterium]